MVKWSSSFDVEVAALCRRVAGARDLRERVLAARQRRETPGTPPLQIAVYSLVECALRSTIRERVPGALQGSLFLHLRQHGCLEEAGLLAICAEDPGLRLAMLAALVGQPRAPRWLRDELARVEARYPGRQPAPLEPDPTSDAHGSFDDYVAEVERDPRKHTWKKSLVALGRSRPVKLPRTLPWPDDQLERLLHARKHVELLGVFLDRPDDLAHAVWLLLELGVSPKTLGPVAWARLRSSSPTKSRAKLDRLAALARSSDSDLPAYFTTIEAIGSSRLQVAELVRWIVAGGEPGAIRRAGLPGEVLGQVWARWTLMASDAKTVAARFQQLVELGTMAPRDYQHCHAAILELGAGREAPPEFARRLEARRVRSKGSTVDLQVVADLDEIAEPVTRVEAFFDTLLERLPRSDRHAAYQALFRRLAPRDLVPLALAVGRLVRSEGLARTSHPELVWSLMAIEALLYHADARRQEYRELALRLVGFGPRRALRLLQALDLRDDEQRKVLFELAYRSDDARELRAQARALGNAPLAEAVLLATGQSPERARRAWLEAAKLPLEARAEQLWCLVGLVLACAGKVELEDLRSLPRACASPGGRALVAAWRTAAGALSERPTTPCPDWLSELLACGGEQEQAKDEPRAPSDVLRRLGQAEGEHLAGLQPPPLEQSLLGALRGGSRPVPFDATRRLSSVRSREDLLDLARAPDLGGEDPLWCHELAEHAERLVRSGNATLDPEVLDALTNLPGLHVDDALPLALAGDAPPETVTRLVRQADPCTLEALHDDLLTFLRKRPASSLRKALAERGPSCALALAARPPSTREELEALERAYERAHATAKARLTVGPRLPREARKKLEPRWEASGHMRAHPAIWRYMKKITDEVPYVEGCFTIWFNPELSERCRVYVSSQGVQAVLSNGDFTVKVTVLTPATTPEEQRAVAGVLDKRLDKDWRP